MKLKKGEKNVWYAEPSDLAPIVKRVILDLVKSGEWSVEKANEAIEEVRIREAKVKLMGDKK